MGMFSVNVSSLSVGDFGFSTLRNLSTTASLDNSSTNLTTRAPSFGPISMVSEALSPLHLVGMMGCNYTSKLRRTIVVGLVPGSKDVTSRQPYFMEIRK